MDISEIDFQQKTSYLLLHTFCFVKNKTYEVAIVLFSTIGNAAQTLSHLPYTRMIGQVVIVIRSNMPAIAVVVALIALGILITFLSAAYFRSKPEPENASNAFSQVCEQISQESDRGAKELEEWDLVLKQGAQKLNDSTAFSNELLDVVKILLTATNQHVLQETENSEVVTSEIGDFSNQLPISDTSSAISRERNSRLKDLLCSYPILEDSPKPSTEELQELLKNFCEHHVITAMLMLNMITDLDQWIRDAITTEERAKSIALSRINLAKETAAQLPRGVFPEGLTSNDSRLINPVMQGEDENGNLFFVIKKGEALTFIRDTSFLGKEPKWQLLSDTMNYSLSDS